jgi:hypothetical protein
MDRVTFDGEASVAKKTRPANQSLGVAVSVRLKRKQSTLQREQRQFTGRTAIHLTRIIISLLRAKGQQSLLSHS